MASPPNIERLYDAHAPALFTFLLNLLCIINGRPLKYRRTDSGRFILYSVGWNEKDDGGVVALTKNNPPRQDTEKGDWVWHTRKIVRR